MDLFLIGFAFGAVIGGLVVYILEMRHQIRFLDGLRETTRNEMRRMTDKVYVYFDSTSKIKHDDSRLKIPGEL